MKNPEVFGKNLASLIRRYSNKKLTPLIARIEVLERRLAEVEGKHLDAAGERIVREMLSRCAEGE